MVTITSPAVLGALRALGVVVLIAVLNWFGDATNLAGIFSPAVDSIIAMIALAIEHSMASQTGSALFGAIKTR
jgi:hypothetical protein